MTPERASAIAVTAALTVWLLIVAFNLGRVSMSAAARQCKPTALTYAIPFKGTLP